MHTLVWSGDSGHKSWLGRYDKVVKSSDNDKRREQCLKELLGAAKPGTYTTYTHIHTPPTPTMRVNDLELEVPLKVLLV
jgi:hypothetical protein